MEIIALILYHSLAGNGKHQNEVESCDHLTRITITLNLLVGEMKWSQHFENPIYVKSICNIYEYGLWNWLNNCENELTHTHTQIEREGERQRIQYEYANLIRKFKFDFIFTSCLEMILSAQYDQHGSTVRHSFSCTLKQYLLYIYILYIPTLCI